MPDKMLTRKGAQAANINASSFEQGVNDKTEHATVTQTDMPPTNNDDISVLPSDKEGNSSQSSVISVNQTLMLESMQAMLTQALLNHTEVMKSTINEAVSG